MTTGAPADNGNIYFIDAYRDPGDCVPNDVAWEHEPEIYRKYDDLARTIYEEISVDTVLTKALSFSVRNISILGYTLLRSRSLGQFSDRFARYNARRIFPAKVNSSLLKDEWVFDVTQPSCVSDPSRRLFAEEMFMQSQSLVQNLTGMDVQPLRLEFRLRDVKRDRAIEDRIGVKVISGMERDAMILTPEQYRIGLKVDQADLDALCASSCDQLLESLKDGSTLVQSIREQLIRSINQVPDLTELCDTLAMTKRSVNRRIADHGTTYRDIVRRFRIEYSMELLRRSSLGLKEVAFEAGYTSASAFRRAFLAERRQSPQAWLQQARS